MENKILLIFILMLSVCLLTTSYTIYLFNDINYKANSSCIPIKEYIIINNTINNTNCDMYDRYQMYNDNISNKSIYLNGNYRANKYYCVWVENKTDWEIEDTDRHEYCHHLVTLAPEHFCGYAYNCTNPKGWYEYNITRQDLINYNLSKVI